MRFKNLGKAVAGAALGLTLAFTSVTPALAATITINNAVAKETYTAYKLFDVTRNNDSYAYSTTNRALMTALKQNAGVSFTEASVGGIWYVKDDGFSAENVASYLSGQIENFASLNLEAASTPVTADDGTPVVFDNLEPGYYFVDSSLGSLCALNTATDTAEIYEKNSKPTIDKKVWEDSANDNAGAYVDNPATIDVTDLVKYQLTVNTGSNTHGSGTGVDSNYVIKDTLPTGITYNKGSVRVNDGAWTLDKDYTVTDDGQLLTITLLAGADSKLSDLGQNQTITITYDATAAKNLATRADHENNVILEYKGQTAHDSVNVKTYELGETAEGEPAITKVDGDNHNTKLQGVKFVVQNSTTGRYAQFDPTTHYLTKWVENREDATELITNEKGNFAAYGLDADTYILTETETLPGYNLLDDTITAVIDPNGNVTYKKTHGTENAAGSITIENNAGLALPTTGGMGTTTIYVVGGVMVVAAGIVLVVRRRMNNEA